jgi:hypothetical protein
MTRTEDVCKLPLADPVRCMSNAATQKFLAHGCHTLAECEDNNWHGQHVEVWYPQGCVPTHPDSRVCYYPPTVTTSTIQHANDAVWWAGVSEIFAGLSLMGCCALVCLRLFARRR